MQRAAVMLAVMALAGTVPGAGADGSKSAPIAHRLATVLAERHLDAIAAADPSSPDRFVAALLYPDVQLLVVGGRYAAPEAMRAQIAAHQDKDVYLALIGSSAPESRLFFQDLKADGLHAEAGGGVDVMYEHVDKQTVFDGKPDPQAVRRCGCRIQPAVVTPRHRSIGSDQQSACRRTTSVLTLFIP